MSSIKKKPKPFKAMSKVLCTGVQRNRIMVMSSLIMVLLGCFALYSAMQNEEWTRDEQSQRKVFFLAFLLLVTSIGLCYYALNGDVEEEEEKIEVERLNSFKYEGYNSIKSDTILMTSEKQKVNNDTEKKLLKLLDPEKKESDRKLQQDIKNKSSKRRANSPTIYNVDEIKTDFNPINTKSEEKKTYSYFDQNKIYEQSEQSKGKSLLVELMPLLPLQLAEQELSKLNNSLQKPVHTPIKTFNCNLPLSQSQIRPDIPHTFSPVYENSDAG